MENLTILPGRNRAGTARRLYIYPSYTRQVIHNCGEHRIRKVPAY